MNTTTSTITPTPIRAGLVHFTPERIEKVRNGKVVTSVTRAQTTSLQVRNESASEHPAREIPWALGAGVLSCVLIVNAWQSQELSTWLACGASAAVCAVLARHLLSTVTVVNLQGERGTLGLDLEQCLKDDQIALLSQRLSSELGWPVVQDIKVSRSHQRY